MKIGNCIAILCLCIFPAKAQLPDDIRIMIEKYLENSETGADYTQVYESLNVYLEKKINLNKAQLTELLEFPLLTHTQSIAIVSHRNSFGPFLNLNELQVAGLPPEQIRTLSSFVTVEKNSADQWRSFKSKLKEGNTEIVNTMGRRYPYKSSDYQGNALSHNIRIRYALPGFFSVGINADKDAGEKYWYDSAYRGPDFYSFHASVQNLGIVKAAVAGDFLLNLGQGLVMGSGLGIGKSALVMNVKRGGPNLKPYRGINEFQFFRGAAVQLQRKKVSWLLAGANNAVDARLGNDSALDQGGFSSVDLDGYHRTRSEIDNRGNTRRNMMGSWLMYQGKQGNVGLGSVNFHYNLPLTMSTEPYRIYYPSGQNLSFHQFFQGYTFRQFHIFSEFAWLQQNRTHGVNVGILSNLGKGVDLALLYRDYSPGFIAPFSTAFGNSTQNEKGLYMGLKMQFHKKLTLSQYLDIWQNPWLAFRNYNPARNTEMFWQLEYTPDRKTSMILRFRHIQRQQNFSYDGPFKYGDDYNVKAIRLHITTPISKAVQLEMRAENALFTQKQNKYNSGLVFAELTTKPKKPRGLSLVARYSLFSVPYYYNRLYAFENQLLYSFGTVAFYGKGYSYYLLLNTKLSKQVKLGLRYNFTRSIAPGETNSEDKQGIFGQLFIRI